MAVTDLHDDESSALLAEATLVDEASAERSPEAEAGTGVPEVVTGIAVPKTFEEAMALPSLSALIEQQPNVHQIVYHAMEMPQKERSNLLRRVAAVVEGASPDPPIEVVIKEGGGKCARW